MRRVVGNDNRMRSTARKGASRVDRLCSLGGPVPRSDDRRNKALPRDSEGPDDVTEKTASGHCIGYRGMDKTLGRMTGRGQ